MEPSNETSIESSNEPSIIPPDTANKDLINRFRNEVNYDYSAYIM